jgi:hypothetical protein
VTSDAAAVGAAKQLAQRDDVVALTGATNAETITALLPILRARGAALISSNAQPASSDTSTIWSTSFLPDEPGRAVANYVRANVDGPVWAMAADNQSGRADTSGFVHRVRLHWWPFGEPEPGTALHLGNHQLPTVPHAGEGERCASRVRVLRRRRRP